MNDYRKMGVLLLSCTVCKEKFSQPYWAGIGMNPYTTCEKHRDEQETGRGVHTNG